MKLSEIRMLPTTIDKVHESVYRSFHILNKVVELLEAGTPSVTIVEIIDDLRSGQIEARRVETGKYGEWKIEVVEENRETES